MSGKIRIHEAGHALMALACGLPFHFAAATEVSGTVWLVTDPEEIKKTPKSKDKYILTAIAGAVTEEVFSNVWALQSLHSGIGSEDMQQVASLGVNLLELATYIGRAKNYIAENKDLVEQLAKVLKEKPVLSQAEVKTILPDVPSFFARPKSKATSRKEKKEEEIDQCQTAEFPFPKINAGLLRHWVRASTTLKQPISVAYLSRA